MKSCIGAFIAGGLAVFATWMVIQNKQEITKYVKDISKKTEQMLQKFKGPTSGNCTCGEPNIDMNL